MKLQFRPSQHSRFGRSGPHLSRRDFLERALGAAAVLAAGVSLPTRVFAASNGHALAAARNSPLIYIAPLKSNGLESRCHGEVWFVVDGEDLLVVTSPERWRAACIGKGLDQARIWVGDFGLWKKSKGAFRNGPSFDAKASLEADRAAHARALAAFGAKYSEEWGKWGPRFTDGLASGERVLIRYSAVS